MILLIVLIIFFITFCDILFIKKTSIKLIELFENFLELEKLMLIPFDRKKIDSPANIQTRQYIWFKLYEKLSLNKKISKNIKPVIKNFIEKLSGDIPILLGYDGSILNIPACLTILQ